MCGFYHSASDYFRPVYPQKYQGDALISRRRLDIFESWRCGRYPFRWTNGSTATIAALINERYSNQTLMRSVLYSSSIYAIPQTLCIVATYAIRRRTTSSQLRANLLSFPSVRIV